MITPDNVMFLALGVVIGLVFRNNSLTIKTNNSNQEKYYGELYQQLCDERDIKIEERLRNEADKVSSKLQGHYKKEDGMRISLSKELFRKKGK